jgi:general secretion pathway protein L
MSTLVLLIPTSPVPLEAADGPGSAPAAAPSWAWVRSEDGAQVTSQGRSPLDALPAADTVVAVVDTSQLAWHRIDVPRVAPPRLPVALAAVLEDHLLDEAERLHFALEPGAQPGRAAWVAVMRADALRAALQVLDRARVDCDRVVPLWSPRAMPHGHFGPGPSGEDDDIRLTWAGPDGVAVLPLRGRVVRAWLVALADRACGAMAGPLDAADTAVKGPVGGTGTVGATGAARLPGDVGSAVQWSAQPAVVQVAERCLDAAVPLLGQADAALRAAASPWDLRQFALAPRRRSTRRLTGLWRAFRAPAWRPVRLGLGALVVLQLVGLNAWAWQQERALAQRRADQVALLRTTHPQVRVVLDAPLQMQRETAALRAAAGRAGEDDLEAALAAAASAWPEGRGPAQALQFVPGRLTLAVDAWREADVNALRTRLRPAGWDVEAAGGRLTLRRVAAGAAR